MVALLVAFLASAFALPVAASPVRTVQDPLIAPAAHPTGDGRTYTDGRLTLSVSQAQALDPAGQTLRVVGSGYDLNKGVYIALCLVPPQNQPPSPCGGGADMNHSSGASQWISNNPPSYAVGLTQPYGADGSFDVTVRVNAAIGPSIDCQIVQCAISTRNDHTRSADRSQDVLVPVAFGIPAAVNPVPTTPAPRVDTGPVAPGPTTSTPSTTPPTTAAPTLITTTTTTPAAPSAKVAADGLSVSDGLRTLRAESVQDLDPKDQELTVSGRGFEPSRGVFVSLCAIQTTDAEGTAPGPCASGAKHSAWLTNDPPEWAGSKAAPFDEGGSFEENLTLEAVIDTQTDCRETPCALVVRADDENADDRSLDLSLPVEFAAESSEDISSVSSGDREVVAADTATADPNQDGSSFWVWSLLIVVVAGGATGAVLWRRRSNGTVDPP